MNLTKLECISKFLRRSCCRCSLSYFSKCQKIKNSECLHIDNSIHTRSKNTLSLRSMSQKSPTLAIPALNLLSPEDSSSAFWENFSCTSFSRNERPFSPPLLGSPASSPPPTPPPPPSPSGHLEEIKLALRKCAAKRDRHAVNIEKDIKDLIHLYPLLNAQEKSDFIIYLATSLSINHYSVTELIKQMPVIEKRCQNNSADIEAFVRWEDKLRLSLQPPYHWLATQISGLTGGVKFLVDLREDLLATLANCTLAREDQTTLKALDANLRDLLSLWFTVGLLELERITWESSCLILQKVSEYEAVHPVRNWTDLKRRVGNYRRCFIFTHSCMPKEPLVVLHTFLTNSISNSMGNIVHSQSVDASIRDVEDTSSISTAIFYSITSTQKGLKGIELGNYLIKRVVKELQAEFPHLKQFSSLSPIPGFVKWLETQLVKARRGEVNIFTQDELESLKNEMQVVTDPDVYAELQRLLKTNAWAKDDSLFVMLEKPLMRTCAYYLFIEKRRAFALDSVANFHLRNGAVMWRLNWNADGSPRGLHNSCGIMINYRYFLEDCDKNSSTYAETCIISASEEIINLATAAQKIFDSSKYKPS